MLEVGFAVTAIVDMVMAYTAIVTLMAVIPTLMVTTDIPTFIMTTITAAATTVELAT